MRSNGKTAPNKRLTLLAGYDYVAGSRKRANPERRLDSMKFKIHKFNNRTRPTDKSKILVVPTFYEFGVETIGLSFCLPQIIHKNPDRYVILVGWYGRSYLYSRIADEYWELDEEHQWLREYSDAFKNESRNISRLQGKLSNVGTVVPGDAMAQLCVEYFCLFCKLNFVTHQHIETRCPQCDGQDLVKPIFGDLGASKKRCYSVPRPSQAKVLEAERLLKPRSVGVFARNRGRYGRNLAIGFYERLLESLIAMGYNPVWMGEKQSVHECPRSDIVNLVGCEDSRDLEFTLAVISKLEFTVQFYTASTRLASMVKTPWILFESADQVVGNGQEGMRVILTTDFDKKKIVISNFQRLAEDQDGGLSFFERAVREVNNGNFETIVAMVDNQVMTEMNMRKLDYWWKTS